MLLCKRHTIIAKEIAMHNHRNRNEDQAISRYFFSIIEDEIDSTDLVDDEDAEWLEEEYEDYEDDEIDLEANTSETAADNEYF